MLRFSVVTLLLAGASVGVFGPGCGLEASGSGDLFTSPEGGSLDGATTDASRSGSDSGASSEAGGGSDGGAGGFDASAPDAGQVCVPTVELCNDGVDNDCNGLVDCADPACQPRFACTSPVPPGWVLSEFAPTTRPTCDALFGASRDVVENPKGDPATCACTCALDPAGTNVGSCSLGVATMLLYSGDTCTTVPTTRSLDVSTAVGGACAKVTPTLGASSSDTSISVLAPGYLPGSCTVNPTSNIPAVTNDGSGRVCASTAALGGGCGPQAVCAPIISPTFGTCISHAGIATCPSAYPNQHILGAQVVDTRACSACSCVGTGTCDSPTLTLFDSGGCNDGGGGGNDGGGDTSVTVTGDGSCQTFPASSTTYNHFTYSATPTPTGCSTFGGAPTGSVTVDDPATVCCP